MSTSVITPSFTLASSYIELLSITNPASSEGLSHLPHGTTYALLLVHHHCSAKACYHPAGKKTNIIGTESDWSWCF